MSSENEKLVNTNGGGIKRHHSIENFEPVKEAKTEKTPQKSVDTKSKEVTKVHLHHQTETSNECLEKGDIVFMYKPKLGVDEASSLDEVQLFHVMLIPEDETNQGDQSSKTRLIKIGKKKLPASGKDRFWAFIEKADDDLEKVEENLEAQSYQTATVGTRTIKADRIAGKGKYIMVKEDKNRTAIGYVLESPAEVGEVQHAFNITKEASFSLAVKNPKKKNPAGAGLTSTEKAEFPEELLKKFGDYQWLPAEPAMLDILGCEMIWIGSTTDALENLLEELNKEIDDETTASEVMKDIQLDEKQHPTQPLIDGEWPKAEDAPEKKNDETSSNE
ncbi:unnamed protein product [Adineta ricciae]|uniref:Uncharacterized protein n=1 Tax=Adineta ricciae TaxID=249248 RepID=A0A814YGD2_ADIRI|nr:unnamed protein product [Adineta ricciae]CAF1228774.1 unnamed protein product [Adineta ricciae]